MNKRKIELFKKLHGVICLYVDNDGKIYLNRPDMFTGIYYSWYENGQKEYEWCYKDGALDGISHGWFHNGFRHFKNKWKDGKCDTFSKCDGSWGWARGKKI